MCFLKGILYLLAFGNVCSENCNSLGGRKSSHSVPCTGIFPAYFKPPYLPLFHCLAEVLFKNCSQVFWKHIPNVVSDKIFRFFSYLRGEQPAGIDEIPVMVKHIEIILNTF